MYLYCTKVTCTCTCTHRGTFVVNVHVYATCTYKGHMCYKCRVSWVWIPPEATHFHFFICLGYLSLFFHLKFYHLYAHVHVQRTYVLHLYEVYATCTCMCTKMAYATCTCSGTTCTCTYSIQCMLCVQKSHMLGYYMYNVHVHTV